METRVALMGIIVEEPERAAEVNELLHRYSEYVVGRMGVPYRARGVNIISVVLDTAGRDLRPQREDGSAGGRKRQNAVLQRDHTDRRQIGMLHDSFV